ncbi:hypothetical protein GCM10009635_07020 [Actinocatenispora thailandica]
MISTEFGSVSVAATVRTGGAERAGWVRPGAVSPSAMVEATASAAIPRRRRDGLTTGVPGTDTMTPTGHCRHRVVPAKCPVNRTRMTFYKTTP